MAIKTFDHQGKSVKIELTRNTGVDPDNDGNPFLGVVKNTIAGSIDDEDPYTVENVPDSGLPARLEQMEKDIKAFLDNQVNLDTALSAAGYVGEIDSEDPE